MCSQTKSKDIHFYIQGEADHLFTVLGDRTKRFIFIYVQRVDSIGG